MVDLEKAIKSLSSNDVDYVIVGGVAIKLHSSAYITNDLDFCYSRTKGNLGKLEQALLPFNPRPRNFPKELPFVFDSSTLRNATNFALETSIGDIDLLGEVKGIGDFSAVLASSVSYEIYGHLVNALNIDGLIVSKTAADRPKDHLVLPELWALKEALDPNEE